MNTTKRCDTCAAFNAFPEPQCRRKSVQLITMVGSGQMKFFGTWPPTNKDDWCLEWIAGAEAGELAQ